MPFKSEAQRKYLWANEPKIARDWTDTYGSRIQKAGGQLVQPGAGRPGYGGPQDWGQEARGTGAYSGPSEPSWEGGGYDQPSAPETKTVERGDASIAEQIAAQDRNRRQDLSDIITRGEEEKWDTPEQRSQGKWSGTTQGIEKRQTFLEKQALDNWNAVKASGNTWLKKKAGKAVVDHFLLGGATLGLSDVIGGLIQAFKTNKAKQEFINVIKGSIAEYRKLGIPEYSPHTDTLIQTREQQLLDLTQTRDRPDGDDGGPGGPEVSQETGITYDDMEGYNEKTRLQQKYREMDEASTAAWLRQQEMEAKKQAYLAAFRQQYLMGPSAMAAEGGRIPGGYNTGGLSNLFRLKNI